MELEELKKMTKSYKVLYVEDSIMVRKVTHKLLSTYFEHIDLAKDGLEAFQQYKKFHEDSDGNFYDIVITDLEMPVMDGEIFSKKILELNDTQEIIVISSVEDFKRLVDLINLGITKFISKPIEEEQLHSVLSHVYQNLHNKKLKLKEALEIKKYNDILKLQKDENKIELNAKIKELEEFSHALDVSAIVSKTDTKGYITYVNEHFCNISGYTQEELIGKNNNIFKSGNKSQDEYKKLWETISSKKIFKSLFENINKDGSVFYMQTTINPILDVDGNIVEYIAVSHDMTQLMNALEEAKKAKKAKEDFFINISHEMRTPLNSILGFSALLQKRLHDDEKSLLMVNTIHDTGNDLNQLIESIIDMRKIQEHSLALIEVAFNPYDEISRIVNKYVKESFEKEQLYIINIDSRIPNSLTGDPKRVTQIIGEVISNAIKFTPNGGQINVDIEYDKIDELLIFQIKDSGIGISKDDQGKIFNMQQLDSKTNRAHEGSGLGLCIVNRLVNMMNGKISLKSIPEKGSLFIIELPLKK